MKKVTNNARAREKDIKPRITYSLSLVATILDRVANGEPLSKVCSGDEMPTRKSFFEWVVKYPELKEQYEMAISMRADLYAEETVSISDEAIVTIKHDGEDMELSLDAAAVARNRLRVDARKWYASKLAPKKYGDRTTLAGDADNPVAFLTMDQITANPASRIKLGTSLPKK